MIFFAIRFFLSVLRPGPRREIPVGLRCLVSARGRSGSRRFHLVRKRTSPQPEVDHQDDPAILGRLAGVPRELEGHHESVLPQHRHPAHAAAGSAAVRERSIHHGECRSPAHRIDRSNFVGGVTARPERDVPVGRVPDQFRPASRSKVRACVAVLYRKSKINRIPVARKAVWLATNVVCIGWGETDVCSLLKGLAWPGQQPDCHHPPPLSGSSNDIVRMERAFPA